MYSLCLSNLSLRIKQSLSLSGVVLAITAVLCFGIAAAYEADNLRGMSASAGETVLGDGFVASADLPDDDSGVLVDYAIDFDFSTFSTTYAFGIALCFSLFYFSFQVRAPPKLTF